MNLRRISILAVVYVGSGAFGSVFGFLASLPFSGPAYTAAWFLVGIPVAGVCGSVAENAVAKKGWL
jgi:hypothetical protein